MRLSEWQKTTQGAKVMTAKVAAAYEPALRGVGAVRDPVAYVVWGDDPGVRYTIFAATDAGLGVCNVRVNVPQEGPRATAQAHPLEPRRRSATSTSRPTTATAMSWSRWRARCSQGVDEPPTASRSWIAHLFARIDGRVPLGPRSRPAGPRGGHRDATRARQGSAAPSVTVADRRLATMTP